MRKPEMDHGMVIQIRAECLSDDNGIITLGFRDVVSTSHFIDAVMRLAVDNEPSWTAGDREQLAVSIVEISRMRIIRERIV